MSNPFASSILKRSQLLNEHTDCCRLIDGIGDGFPDLFLETYAERWLASTRGVELPLSLLHLAEQEGRTLYHKQLDQDQKLAPSHRVGPPQEKPFLARENGQNIWIDFQAGYSQGIFLDQRNNRRELHDHLTHGSTLLNTFAYTGAFSVAASLAGATTTTLDLSQPYLDWAKRNFEANQIDPDKHYFCKGDTLDWLHRFNRSGRSFDGIVLDPPTFSRDAKGKIWRVEKNYHELVSAALNCLNPGGFILATTNCRKLPPHKFELQILEGLAGHPARLEERSMPSDFPGEPYLKSFWIFTDRAA